MQVYVETVKGSISIKQGDTSFLVESFLDMENRVVTGSGEVAVTVQPSG